MFQADIPGGTCMIRRSEEITTAHGRALMVALLRFGRDRLAGLLQHLAGTDDPWAALTPKDMADLESISDVTIWAVLGSWTLPDPIPDSPAAVGALPAHLREALADVTAGEGKRLLEGMLGEV